MDTVIGQLAFGLACALSIPVLIGWFVCRTGGMWEPSDDPKIHRTKPNRYVVAVCLGWGSLSSWMQGNSVSRLF